MKIPQRLPSVNAAFVIAKTREPVNTLKATKPNEAASWPMKSHLETPLFEPARHCLRTCAAMVTSKIMELAHPMASVTSLPLSFRFRRAHSRI